MPDRNTVLMPGINNFDVSVAKKFNFTEKKYFEFRADFTNSVQPPAIHGRVCQFRAR